MLVTSVYVVLTYKALRVTQEATRGAHLAIIGISHGGPVHGAGQDDQRHEINLHVLNSGTGPAFDFKPRIRVGPRMRRSVVDFSLNAFAAPDVIDGTARAYEPTNRPPGVYEKPGVTTEIGSRLEDTFSFLGPKGWEPSDDVVRTMARIEWSDSTGRHRARRVITAPLKGLAVWD